jgi:NAD+ diphosphatase
MGILETQHSGVKNIPIRYASICFNLYEEYVSTVIDKIICLVVDKSGNTALIKQNYVSDHYVCVAGYVKQGERIEETAKREVEEETGCTVYEAKYINSYYYGKRDNLMLGFVCVVANVTFKLSREVDSAKWFSLAEAENRLRPGSIGQDLLRDYLALREEQANG